MNSANLMYIHWKKWCILWKLKEITIWYKKIVKKWVYFKIYKREKATKIFRDIYSWIFEATEPFPRQHRHEPKACESFGKSSTGELFPKFKIASHSLYWFLIRKNAPTPTQQKKILTSFAAAIKREICRCGIGVVSTKLTFKSDIFINREMLHRGGIWEGLRKDPSWSCDTFVGGAKSRPKYHIDVSA